MYAFDLAFKDLENAASKFVKNDLRCEKTKMQIKKFAHKMFAELKLRQVLLLASNWAISQGTDRKNIRHIISLNQLIH